MAITFLGLRLSIGVTEALCFRAQGCPFVTACFRATSVRACVRPGISPVSTISYEPVDGVSPTMADNVVDGTR